MLNGTEAGYELNPTATATHDYTASQVRWYSLPIAAEASDSAGTYLDIDTLDSDDLDTEIGLYDANGNLIGTSDNSGDGLFSLLSFGRTDNTGGERGAIGGLDDPVGQDGSLAAGDYYLAVGLFNTTFNPDFNVTSNSGDLGNVTINLRTNIAPVPEPGSLMLAAAAALGFGVFRQRTRTLLA